MVEAATLGYSAGHRGSGTETARSSAYATKSRATQNSGYDPLKVQVNLSIHGRKLKDLDRMSKSDPMCIIFEMK